MNPSAAIICLCIVAVYSAGEKTSKSKRDVSGLFPFPRVGRGGDLSWSSRYLGSREVKRQGLIPFPRVGRNGDGNAEKKGDIAENGGAMWFGPRLGRLQKRNYLNEDDWALVQIKDLTLPSNKKEYSSGRSGRDAAAAATAEDVIDSIRDYRQ